MSIKVKYSDVSGGEFQNCVSKIAATSTDGYTAYRINKFVNAVQVLRKKIMDEFLVLQEKHGKKDEKGALVSPFAATDEEAFEKVAEEFGNSEGQILWSPLTAKDITGVKISPREIEVLKPVMDMDTFEQKVPNISQLRA